MIINIKYYVIIVYFIALAPCYSAANSMIDYVQPDADIISESYDVVEGKITFVDRGLNDKKCFTGLYKLKVNKSVKGNVANSEEISIGVNVNTFKVKKGDQYIILLRKSSSSYLSQCPIKKHSKEVDVGNLKIGHGHVVSMFKINKKNNYFDARSCEDVPIMFEHYFSEKGIHVKRTKQWNGVECRTLKGDLKILEEMLGFEG